MSNYNPQEALKQYQKLGIESEVSHASPHRLIQLLFEGGDIAVKGEMLGKAIGIVGGLRSSLDMEAGELSERLDQLYEYINLRLLEASTQNDIDKVTEVIQLLKTVKSGWDDIGAASTPKAP